MSNGLTFEILIQILQNFQGRRRNTWKDSLLNFMEIDLELTEKSAKNTQLYELMSMTIVKVTLNPSISRCMFFAHCSSYFHPIFMKFDKL